MFPSSQPFSTSRQVPVQRHRQVGKLKHVKASGPRHVYSNSTWVQKKWCPPCPHRAPQVNFGSAQLFGITLRITERVRAMSTSNFTPCRQNDHVFWRVNDCATLHCGRSLCLCRSSARWRLPLAVLVYTAIYSLIDIMQTGMWHPNRRPSGWLVIWFAAKETYQMNLGEIRSRTEFFGQGSM